MHAVLTHLEHEVLPNNTIKGGRIAHIGQVFFDQSLLDDIVAKVPVYKGNKVPPTKNNHDFIMAFDTAGGFDPVVEYAMLGKTLEDGLLGWINFGVNVTNSHATTRAAASCGADGCKANPFSRAGFGKAGKGGKGGFPGKGGMPGMPGMGKGGELPKGLVMPTLADLLTGLFGGIGKGAPAAAAPKAPGA
jgi:hypothetical protein